MNYESSIKNNIITYHAWLFLCTFLFSASLFSANENPMIKKLIKGDCLEGSVAMIEQNSDKVSIKIIRPSSVDLVYEPKDIFFKIPYQNEAISFEYFLNFLQKGDAEQHQAQLQAILTTFFNDNEDLSTFNYGGMYSVQYNNTKTGIIFTARLRVPKHK